MTADLHARIAQLEEERDSYKADALRLHKFATHRLDEIIALKADIAKAREELGWLYIGDEGVEWAQQHPIESGEYPSARAIRPGTAANLLPELQDAWEAYWETVQSEASHGGRVVALTAERDALREQVETWAKLALDLNTFADHDHDCARHRIDAKGYLTCSCGLQKTLDTMAEKTLQALAQDGEKP